MAEQKPNLYDLDLKALEALLTGWGEPAYRAKQIWVWLYKHLATGIDQMSSLPKTLRTRLADRNDASRAACRRGRGVH